MKKNLLLPFFTIIGGASFAQTNTFPTPTGNVGILSTSPTHSLTLGSTTTGIAAYNTADQTNYERVVAGWISNAYTIGSYYDGTGTSPRSLRLGVSTTTAASLARLFTINPNASVSSGVYDYNLSTSGAGSMMTLNYSLSGASVQQNIAALQPTITQSGTAGYTGLLIAPFESTVGTGTKYLIDAGTNTAANGGGTHTSKFTVDNAGNSYLSGSVGIGTTSTYTYKLAVNGSAIATSMTVKLNANWPDYVFKKDYQLQSLDRVKAYIDKNHHLPEMPSAQEVEEKGVNLGEISTSLTKKVEELTLYLIEKDKQLAEQKRLNESFQQQLGELAKQVQLLKQQIKGK